MPALSNEVASKHMNAAKLEPLVPYPGNSKLPWKSRCLQCGNIKVIENMHLRATFDVF